MQHCVICNGIADYYVANPGSNAQAFCKEHFPKFLKVTMPFVTVITPDDNVFLAQEEPVIEEPVIEEPVVLDAQTLKEQFPDIDRQVEESKPKTRKKAAAAPVEEPVTE